MARYIIIAGVNGAGKSTLYHSLRGDIFKLPRVNTDEIVQEFGDWKVDVDAIKAGRIAVQRIREYFEEGVSFNQETTLCGKSIFRNIEKAKNRGYLIELHYVGLASADIAKERVHQRVLKGGHGIPDEKIEQRYEESLRHMQQVMDKCNLVAFYDNTRKIRRIAIYRNGKIVKQSSRIPDWFKKYFNNDYIFS